MKAKKILFATDFSEQSDAARRFATSLARDSGAELLIVHVQEPPPAFIDQGFGGYVAETENEEELARLLSETVPTDPPVPYQQTMLAGHPAEELVRYAAEQQADLIVIGSHGRTGLMRLLMGSVAEAVVRKATCPVLTIKQPHEVAEPVEN